MSAAPSPSSSSHSDGATGKPQLDWVRRWLPVIVWLCVISWFSSDTFSGRATSKYLDPVIAWILPGLSREGLLLAHFIVRKGAHLTEYCILAILMLRAFRPPLPSSWPKAVFMTLAACAAYGFADEFHQYLVPGRTASLKDVAFDFGGALIGVTVFLAVALPRRGQARAGQEKLRTVAEKQLSASD